MSTDLTLPAAFSNGIADVFKGEAATNDALGAGVASSYGIIGFKGKVWSNRYQGVDTPLMREDGDGAKGSIEVVLVDAASAISKIYYKEGYVDGSNAAPDCWSANGVTPDASVQNKCNATCADCPMNAWGSRISDAGKNGKQCADSRRMAVVPLADINNEVYGGPMLLRVPAASLKDLKAYGDLLNGYNYPYYAVATRIAFDPKEAFPKFVLSAMRPLTGPEALLVKALREDKRTKTVLNEGTDVATKPAANPIPESPFEKLEAAHAAEQATATPVGKPVVAPTPKSAPKPKAAAPAGPTAEEVAAAEAAKVQAAKAARIAEIKRKQAEELAALEAEEAAEGGADEGTVEEQPSGGNSGAVTMDTSAFDAMLDAVLK